MRKVVIHEHSAEGQTEGTSEDLASIVRNVAEMIEQGYTSGYYPYWEIVEDGNSNDEDNKE